MFLESIAQNRRSIRKFKEDPISKEQKEALCQAALLAPSANNKRPVELLVIEDREEIQRLAHVKENSHPFYAKASLCIVVLVDKEKAGLTYMQDASIAATYLQAQAFTMGLGSCWINLLGRNSLGGESASQVIKKWYAIPDEFFINCLIPIGYPDEVPKKRQEEKWPEKIHWGNF